MGRKRSCPRNSLPHPHTRFCTRRLETALHKNEVNSLYTRLELLPKVHTVKLSYICSVVLNLSDAMLNLIATLML
jgi:hypothetical protein